MRRGVQGITVDCEGCTDPDDAIWIHRRRGNLVVTVSITDISQAIPVGSELDKEAYKRGVTIYNNGVAPNIYMFPERLATQELCLGDPTRRNVVAVEMSFRDMIPVGTKIFPATLSSQARLTYLQANKILEDEKHEHHWRLLTLSEVAYHLYLGRKKHGRKENLEMWESQTYMQRKELTEAEVTPARTIEELMIAANKAVAKEATLRGIPILYRNHHADGDVAFYSPEAKLHAGIGGARYTHFTSPLRRYVDFVNLHNVMARLTSLKVPFNHFKLEEIGINQSRLLAA